MRGLGYKPDHRDPRDQRFGSLVRATAAPPHSSSALKSYSGGVTDQEDSEGCVGWSLSGAIWTRWNYMAALQNLTYPVARPSAMLPWWMARQTWGMQNINDGTYIRDAVKCVVKLGICPERYWPSNQPSEYVDQDGDPVDEADGVPRYAMQPSVSAFQHAADQRFALGYYRVGDDISLRKLQVMQALSSGYPVVLGTQLSVGFLELGEHGPQAPPGPGDEIAGGHALQLTHYDELGVYGPNSWGTIWGNAGWFALSWEYVLWQQTQDLWAVDAALPKAWPAA